MSCCISYTPFTRLQEPNLSAASPRSRSVPQPRRMRLQKIGQPGGFCRLFKSFTSGLMSGRISCSMAGNGSSATSLPENIGLTGSVRPYAQPRHRVVATAEIFWITVSTRGLANWISRNEADSRDPRTILIRVFVCLAVGWGEEPVCSAEGNAFRASVRRRARLLAFYATAGSASFVCHICAHG
ncbi:hypothetical protein GY45DRAFT_1326332 [Cubamyces sp. BRFM 1775]|nr:hypothetical protein GY45DRAFT_1326332 [Cubamyces sp. BRFM 1775]